MNRLRVNLVFPPRLGKFAAWLLVCLALLMPVGGCSQKSAASAPTAAAPTGHWVGESAPGLELDIQEGGSLKITRQGKASDGTWKQNGEGKISASIDGQTSDLPYSRHDLRLSITLPGETQPSDFTQM